MVSAIVYLSETGFTKRYAEILSQKTSLQVYSLQDAMRNMEAEAEIIFMGWIMNNVIQGYLKAKKKFNIRIMIGVGMSPMSDEQKDKIGKANEVDNCAFFYVRGGYKVNEIRESLKSLIDVEAAHIAEKSERSDEQEEMIGIVKNGADFMNEINLLPIVEELKKLERE